LTTEPSQPNASDGDAESLAEKSANERYDDEKRHGPDNASARDEPVDD
jgi:hypothetical protein